MYSVILPNRTRKVQVSRERQRWQSAEIDPIGRDVADGYPACLMAGLAYESKTRSECAVERTGNGS
jgi:hypothetical protein